MPRVPAVKLCAALQKQLRAIKLEAAVSEEALLEVVELYGNKNLDQALADLVITKGRVCLIVPTGIRRMHEDFASDRVLTKRYLEVDLLIADRAYYKAGQVAVFGGDKNLGVLEMSELIEEVLAGKDLSAYGPAIFDDGAQQTVKHKDTSREAFIQTLLIPAGTIETVTSDADA